MVTGKLVVWLAPLISLMAVAQPLPPSSEEELTLKVPDEVRVPVAA